MATNLFVSDEIKDVKCRFGCAEVVGIYHVPAGCICWTDPVQALCAQHAETAESNGPITLLVGRSTQGGSDRG